MRQKKIEKDNITYINSEDTKKVNKKKLIAAIIILSIIVILIILFMTYSFNEKFRVFCDNHIFQKNIEERNLTTINLDDINNSKIFAYSNYIGVIKDNTINQYNSSGKEEQEIKIEVTTPLISICENYVAIAEKSGQRLYLLTKNGIVWQKDLEGNISRISVNANGYVSVILSGTAYKSVIELFNDSGEELFKTYLSNTIAVDTAVSDDNKYLSFAEVNISGTLIQSNIKQIEIAKAKENPSNAITYTYNADANSLIINIKYQNNNKLVCQYDNSIHLIDNSSDKKIMDINAQNQNNVFVDINLNNNVLSTSEESTGIFSTNTAIKLTNILNQKENIYNINGSVKNIYCASNKIGINLGSEIHFIDTNGWLVKKYTTSQSIKDVVISNNIAGVIYKNKIEILNL